MNKDPLLVPAETTESADQTIIATLDHHHSQGKSNNHINAIQ